jgi:hypothetical protein
VWVEDEREKENAICGKTLNFGKGYIDIICTLMILGTFLLIGIFPE